MKRAIAELKTRGYLTNPTKELDFMIWWSKSQWAFMVAVDPVDSYVKCENKSNRINPNLPSIIFQTALPMKDKCPWTKNPEDIKIIINECKNIFEIIEINS